MKWETETMNTSKMEPVIAFSFHPRLGLLSMFPKRIIQIASAEICGIQKLIQ